MSDALKTFLVQPPASFVWVGDTGTSQSCVIDLLPKQAQLVALFPPDRPAIAARSGTLMLLLLTYLRRDWLGAAEWLQRAMQAGESVNYSRQVSFTFDRKHSRATLRIELL